MSRLGSLYVKLAAASGARHSRAMSTEAQEHMGPPGRVERRRHRVYVTKNTEYHFRDGFCVAVRDRQSGDFLPGHLALRKRLHGGLKFKEREY